MGAGRGNAKLILVGEHWVLDGARALAIGLPSLAVDVELTLDPTVAGVQVDSPAPEQALLGAAAMATLALAQVGVATGAQVRVDSQVPLRRGLGSSAALAVALVRAADAAVGRPAAGVEEVGLRAKDLEDLIHGRSSGLDPAAAATGSNRTADGPGSGGVLFCSGRVERRLGPVHANLRKFCWLLMDLGQGQPTREAIAIASARRAAMDPAQRQALADATSAAADQAADGLETGDFAKLASALRSAAAVLEPLGVINAPMERCIAQALAHGALAAKQTGAGLGGVILALCPDQAVAAQVAAACTDASDHWTVPLSLAPMNHEENHVAL